MRFDSILNYSVGVSTRAEFRRFWGKGIPLKHCQRGGLLRRREGFVECRTFGFAQHHIERGAVLAHMRQSRGFGDRHDAVLLEQPSEGELRGGAAMFLASATS